MHLGIKQKNLFYDCQQFGHKRIQTMCNKESSPIILIYYNFRGQAQPIRNQLSYLKLPFFQIHLQNYQQQKASVPQIVKSQLKGLKIDKNLLPLLFHEGIVVTQTFSIMTYLCYRFEREDLLGSTIYQKAKVIQLMDIYFTKQPQSMLQMFRIADFVTQNIQYKDRIQSQLYVFYHKVMKQSGYLKEICNYLLQNEESGFIIGQALTIADFIFLQSCNYMLGVFGEVDQNNKLKNKSQDCLSVTIDGEDSLKYLKLMRKYRAKIMEQQFYQKHSEYLESFSIISKFLSIDKIIGLRAIWLGNVNFIK